MANPHAPQTESASNEGFASTTTDLTRWKIKIVDPFDQEVGSPISVRNNELE